MKIINEEKLNNIIIPPNSLEAEQSVIGGILIDNTSWDYISDILSEEDFYQKNHRIIWLHIANLLNINSPADVITVNESINKFGNQNKIKISYLNKLAYNTPSPAHISYYAKIVRESSILRRLSKISYEIFFSIVKNKGGKNAQKLLDEAESKIFNISQKNYKDIIKFKKIQPLLNNTIKKIKKLCKKNNNSDLTGISTGFTDLDKNTSGLQPGDLIIVAGRPSMGKTSFSMNIVENVAIKQKLPVAIFSMEMGAMQLSMRMLGSVGMIDQHKIRTGKLLSEDWSRINNAIKIMEKAQIYIDDTPTLNSIELRSRSRTLARKCGKIGLIIIDYIQLMSGNGGENRATEISEISRSIKSLAKELDCPLIALSQLNRSLEQRPNKRPIMSDLRESGAIEQDADLILFIYRDEIYNPNKNNKGIAEIIIGKQRNGPIGTLKLNFNGMNTKFLNHII